MLILFKPWRTIYDLLTTNESWLESFIKFEISLKPKSTISVA